MSGEGDAGGSGRPGPVSVENCQQKLPVAEELLERLAAVGREALRIIEEENLSLSGKPEEVSVSLLDDVMIGEVHGQYMDDPSPTDVITFPYGTSGEVLIGVETAERQAVEFGVSRDREIALYLVHGILHLCGYEDTHEEGRKRMAVLQEEVLEAALERSRSAN